MDGLQLLSSILGFLVAIVVHESAHAFAADKLGDATARLLGRVSFNPLKHIDPVGTILVPGFMILASAATGIPFVFGWAKPVPVNMFNFRNPLRDRLLTALAGPMSNLLAAIVLAIVFRFLPAGTHLPQLVQVMMFINLVLMLFNLIPLPPLDGAAVLPFLLRGNPALLQTIETRGFLFVLGLLLLDSFMGGAILNTLVQFPALWLMSALLGR